MDSTLEHHIQFTRNVLVKRIIDANPDLAKQKLVSVDIKSTDELNGFMSNIIFLKLTLENGDGISTEHKLVVKLMKGSEETRHLMKANIQFPNEIAVYRHVIPAFLQKFKDKFVTIDQNLWCPKIYFAEVGSYPELSSHKIETLLAVEDLTPGGYKLGGRSNLTPAEMKLMAKAIGQYHSCSIAMKIEKDPLIFQLKEKLIPFRFESEKGRCLYNILYEVAYERFFNYIDTVPDDIKEIKPILDLLREKYGNCPLKLMESFLEDDPDFSVIQHGDYNRNNVLFQYDSNGNPTNLRMFDFQEVRYGTPAMDLAFYFYMNMDPALLNTDLFEELLKTYHASLISSLCELLQVKEDDEKLKKYSYQNFLKHFNRFAFYGAMVCLHFLPWMTCPQEECEKLVHLWFTDMNSPEFWQLSLDCGGKKTNERCLDVIKRAIQLGHLDILKQA